MPPLSEGTVDDYTQFCQSVFARTRIDLLSYKRQQMERRIRTMAERLGITSLLDYGQYLRGHPEAMREFIDRVTINVSEFFRNPEKFEELRTQVLPELLRDRRPLAIWSAGCSIGAEPYTISILLHQNSAGVAHQILATDVDDGILARARAGVYETADVKNVSDLAKRRYFTAVGNQWFVTEQCKQLVTFRRHDLLRDPFPQRQDLIVCRNVVIYFNDEAKSRLFEKFYAALRPGGYLLVGSTERIYESTRIGFTSPLPFWYQRPL